MTSRLVDPRPAVVPRPAGWLWPVAVLVVLAGVLAMHVLASGHLPAVAGALTHPPTVTGTGSSHLDPSGVVSAVTAPAAAGAPHLNCHDQCTDHAGGPAPGSPSHASHLVDLCLGVLLAGALGGLLLLVGRRALVARRVATDPVAHRATRLAASLRPRPPSPTRLCVLRT